MVSRVGRAVSHFLVDGAQAEISHSNFDKSAWICKARYSVASRGHYEAGRVRYHSRIR